MVTTRSAAGISAESTLSKVVLPDPVPPLTSRFRLPRTAGRSRSAPSGRSDPAATMAARSGTAGVKRRMATTGPSTEAGGIMAWRREPSGRRAATAGEARSRRRPSGAMARSTAATTAAASGKRTAARSSRPARSTQTSSGALTRTSLTAGSASSASSGPRPARASTACAATARRRGGLLGGEPAGGGQEVGPAQWHRRVHQTIHHPL